MEIEENVTSEAFFSRIKNYWDPLKKIGISIIGWQDGDWFLSLCNEHGGPKKNAVEMFEQMPIRKTFSDFSSFVNFVQPYCEVKCLGSIDEEYQFIFDIYIWTGKKLWIYNPYLEKLLQRMPGIIDRLLGRLPSPPWFDETLTNSNQNIKKPPYFSPMASGNKSLVLNDGVNYDNFPIFANKWVEKLQLTVVDKVDGPSERIWKVDKNGIKYLLAYDDWSPEISLEPQDSEAGKDIFEIGKKLRINE